MSLKACFNRNTLYDIIMITIGSFFWVLSLNALIVPNGILSAGLTGVSIIIHNFIPVLPISIIVYILNVPIMIWAWKELNKRFIVYTFYAVTLQSILMELMRNFPTYTGDIMLAAIFAGVFAGVGSGLVIRRNGSGAGTDVIGIIIKKKRGYSVGTVSMIFNTCVICLCAFLYGVEIAMYTIIFIAVFSVCTDKAIAGMGKKYTAMIVTTHPEEMKNVIFDRLHRGVTFLRGKGAFLGDQKDVIYCAINQYELAILKDLIYTIDPDVFMTITETTEIYGHFRKTKEMVLTAAELETGVVTSAQEPVSAVVDRQKPKVAVIDKDHEVIDHKEIETELEDGEERQDDD